MTDERLIELAERCEREAENWRGEPMGEFLITVANRMRAGDFSSRRREEADEILQYFGDYWHPLRRVADCVGKSASMLASRARDLEERGLVESRWIGKYTMKEWRRSRAQTQPESPNE